MPQEIQCEKGCVLARSKAAVAIGKLERFAADYDRGQKLAERAQPSLSVPQGKPKVAVVGPGPAGLTCAGDLARLGYPVTVFESLHECGGVLSYGIPEFRLPKVIVDKEVELLKRMGADVRCNSVIGKLKTVDDLFAQGFDAVFVGTGAGLPYFMGIPGENLNGVYSANEYLTRANLMKSYSFPSTDTPIKKSTIAVVVGGGNVAMDSARTALRLGAEKVHIVYRRSEAEMPARIEEIHHAKEEGIVFNILQNPHQLIGDAQGWLTGVECIRMELGEPDASGRRRPVPVPNSNFVINWTPLSWPSATAPILSSPQTVGGLKKTQSWGGIIVNEKGQSFPPSSPFDRRRHSHRRGHGD